MIQSIVNLGTRPSVRRSATIVCQELVDFLMDKAIPENSEGFTLDPRTLVFSSFDVDTYIVSLQGYEKRCSPSPSRNEVYEWVKLNYATLMAPGHYLGSWLKKSNAVLIFDVSVPVQGLFASQIFGHRNGQESIYHPASGKSILLQPTPIELSVEVVAA